MVQVLDDCIELFLRAAVPLGVRDIDVSFQPPDRTWSAGVTRPTVSLFLFDVRRSAERAQAGREQVEQDGRATWRRPNPRVELRYLVSVWANDPRDEHQLLGGVLRALLSARDLPADYLSGPLATLAPGPTIEVSSTSSTRYGDPSRLLDGQLKACLELVVTTPIDVGGGVPAGPPTTGVDFSLSPLVGAATSTRRLVAGQTEPAAGEGTLVRSPRGVAYVNPAGSFLVPAEAGDEIVLETVPPRSITVPDAGGVVV